tara:strand:- start:25664 stop:28435 length:2772 start_codon:yes stop_codon:yes gene_type:complete
MKLTDIAKNKPILEARKPMSVETAGEENMAQAKAMRPQFTDKQIKMAFGILNDPRYKDGNYDGAHATIEKLAKGLSQHPSVANAMKRANEDIVTEGSYLYLNGKEIDQSTVVYDMQDYSDGMFELHGANYADGTELDEKELEELESTQELIDWVMIDFIEEGRAGDNIDEGSVTQSDVIKVINNLAVRKDNNPFDVRFYNGATGKIRPSTAKKVLDFIDRIDTDEVKSRVMQYISTINGFKEIAQKAGVKVSEGKSPHKKGTAKYKKHMAAMHAEDKFDGYKIHRLGELQKKVDEIAKDIKLLSKTDSLEYSTGAGDLTDQLTTMDKALTMLQDVIGKSNSIVPDPLKNYDGTPKTKKVEEEKRWKQTSMSPEDAIRIWGKKNVQVTPGGLNNGDDMVEVFVEAMNEMNKYGLTAVNKEGKFYAFRHGKMVGGPFDTMQELSDFQLKSIENEDTDTAIPYTFTKKDFDDNEDANMHTENGMEIAKMFGTPQEVKRMEMIMKAHNQRGHILGDEQAERNAIVSKYYDMLEGLDEGMMSDMEKDLMMMYSGDGEPGLADAMGMSEKEFAQAYTKAGSDIQKMIKNYVKANEDINVEIPEDMYERIRNYSASLNEGYSILPDMPAKYVARDGLEGPIMTRSGKVVYYDPKEGKYYDPDTDIYLTYDEWKAFDPELPIKSEAIDAVLAQADGYSVVKDDGDDIHIMYNDEIIGGASFDSGSDSFWVSTGEAGQESFDTAQDIIDYYAQNKITEIASPDEQATHSNVALDTLRKIVADKQNMPVKFADGQMNVDLYSASAITQVFDKINPQNQAKLLGMMGTKAGMIKVTNLVFGMMNKKGDHSVAETEGPVSEYTGNSIGVKEMEQMLVTLADKKVNSIAYQRFISGSDKYKADPALAKELEGDKKKLAADVNESVELDRIKYLSGL